ncbi:phosphotransferase [Mycobacterium sp.]|uniref:phosphotransferase n=1 Tax=Mycobacterium sp. TaxID=1785 RepID=UPI003BAF8EAE
MHPKLWLAGRAGAIAWAMAGEKLRPQPPRTRADIPRDGFDINEAWLTDVLCHGRRDARVVGYSTEAGTSQTTTRSGLRVEYNDAGREAGLPTELYTKTTAGFTQRLLLGGAHILDGEPTFYTRFRPRIEMEAPLGYWGGVDPRSWRSMVLLEDIAATKGATFISATTPLTRSQVEDVVVNLGKCHGAWWEDPALAELKTTADHLGYVKSFVNMGKRCAVGLNKAASVIPASMRDQADRLWAATRRSLEHTGLQGPRTLLHGDPHVGQVYITNDGRAGLTDWQSIMTGSWAYDFTYFVTSACETDDRRTWERELLDLYLTTVADSGGKPPATEDAWTAYRQNAAYPCAAWAWAYGHSFYQPEMQPEDACRIVIRRTATAVADLDTLTS